MKKIYKMTLLFDLEGFGRVHLYKDVGMIPIYFHRKYNINSSIVYYDNVHFNSDLKENELDVELHRINKNFLNDISYLRRYLTPMTMHLFKNAKKIDLLMLFHNKRANFYYRKIYKFLNKKGVTYLKLDMDLDNIIALEKLYEEAQSPLGEFNLIGYIKMLFKKRKYNYNINELLKFDVVSVETYNFYERLKILMKNSNNLKWIPNGFSYEGEGLLKVKSFAQKKNALITVGRIGSFQKNNEMLLNALEKLDFKDWEAYFIGPIEPSFVEVINKFFETNSHLRDKIKFIGNVKSKQELYNYYNESKVFCLTSRYEGFPLVFPEALYFGNYIISTKVGAEMDITKGGVLGKIINTDCVNSLTEELQSIIYEEKNIGFLYGDIIRHSEENFMWDSIVERLYEYLNLD